MTPKSPTNTYQRGLCLDYLKKPQPPSQEVRSDGTILIQTQPTTLNILSTLYQPGLKHDAALSVAVVKSSSELEIVLDKLWACSPLALDLGLLDGLSLLSFCFNNFMSELSLLRNDVWELLDFVLGDVDVPRFLSLVLKFLAASLVELL